MNWWIEWWIDALSDELIDELSDEKVWKEELISILIAISF